MLGILFCGVLAPSLIKGGKSLQTKINHEHGYLSVVQEQKQPYPLIHPCVYYNLETEWILKEYLPNKHINET